MIVGLLSWYDENPAWLAELVASLARVGVEHVVAVDGAYMLLQGGKAASPPEQADVIYHTARGAGMGATIYTPLVPWQDEMTKRTRLFEQGHLVATPGIDWLWVIDADELVIDAPGIREQLDASDHEVAEVLMADGDGGHDPVRRLFRAQQDGIRVINNHLSYVTADGRLLGLLGDYLEAEETLWDTRMLHRRDQRRPERANAQRAYYTLRDKLGVERDHVAA